jgi:hypothetical protein
MALLRLFLALGLGVVSTCLTASLRVMQTDPLVVQLSFSQPTVLPPFQLLYNGIYNTPYSQLSS